MKEVIHPTKVNDPRKHKNVRIFPHGAPWSQAVKAEGAFLFISGQTARTVEGDIVGVGDIVEQTRKTLENLKSVLEELGGSLADIVATTWYTTSIDDFYESGASSLRNKYFKKDFPTTTLVEVKRLADPKILVEVSAIAVSN